MSTAYAHANGIAITSVRINVPRIGPWFADVELADDSEIDDSVTLTLGSATFKGTLRRNGAFVMQRRIRVVAGADGWSSLILPKTYRGSDDVGVKASLVVGDLATEIGETLTEFTGGQEFLFPHCCRADWMMGKRAGWMMGIKKPARRAPV